MGPHICNLIHTLLAHPVQILDALRNGSCLELNGVPDVLARPAPPVRPIRRGVVDPGKASHLCEVMLTQSASRLWLSKAPGLCPAL